MYNLIYIGIIILIIILDQGSKHIISSRYNLGDNIKVYRNLLFIRVVKNTGAAFSILKGRQRLIKSLTILSIILLTYYIYISFQYDGLIWIKIGLSFILGGSLGNLIDRIRDNGVLDFIYIKLKGWPIFNIADIFIFLGTIIVLVG
ncbi:signal peptidase II [Clostridiisalibacter paucivorans]|uniref:signal peptidase II n=1 Tax=Clostridiisalibacter paucivorans TaxID=408753 RepID=UPI000554FAFA|nr:signal peptidase II [Clostridiisalibacter paucivorans]